MKISSIPQIYQHLSRWREIVMILSRYGLADWIDRLNVSFARELFKDSTGEALAGHSAETRVRLALNELGPTFIKLGQVLSTRPDLVGTAMAKELTQLQDGTTADRPEVVRATILSDFGRTVEELFASFDDLPLASASIGQVHGATLKTGERVVVKVRHANIESKVEVDLEILSGIAELADQIPEFENYRPTATVAEFQRTLRRELDFGREARYLEQFANDFADDPFLHVPRVFGDYCTTRVLTMERLDGISLNETARLHSSGIDLAKFARAGADVYMRMIFLNGFYHADPHPGNLLALSGGRLALLDFGMVGRIDEPLREDLEEMILAITARDARQLTAILMRIGKTPPGLDEAALSLDIAEFVLQYTSMRLDRFDLSGALNDMVEMIRRYHITLPARVAMLIKVLVMLEGTSHLLDPRFNLLDIMQPYQRQMLWRRMSPVRRGRKLLRFAGEMERFIGELPRGLSAVLEQLQEGKFEVHLDHRGLEPSVNRLVFGLLTSALFLGSALLLRGEMPPVLTIPWVGNFSLFGFLGAATSIALGLRLIRAINKSGHLDSRG